MNRTFLHCALVVSTLFLGSARAAYNPAIVSSEARWVVYADFNALRGSTLGKELIAAVEAAQKEATGGMIGIDVPKLLGTIGALTAYGTNFMPDPKLIDGALIAQGTPDLRKIAESMLLQGTLADPNVFSEVTDLPFPAYAIANPQVKEGDKTQLVVAFPPEPVVIVSKSKAQLIKARDVMRGAANSLAKTPGSPLTKMAANAQGAFLFSASVVPTEEVFPKNAPQARILQLTHSASVAIGERGPDMFVHSELLASSDANAERLMKILQGLTAMLGLAESNDELLAEFLRSVEVTRDRNTVTLGLAYPGARLATMVKTLRMQANAPDTPAPRRAPPITLGRVLAEWGGDTAAGGTGSSAPATRTIEGVKLANGALITIGRLNNGAQNVRFTGVEIMPEGGGSPMTFKTDFMRNVRGTMWQFPFPGTDGVYTLRVGYVPDAEGRAKFAASVSEPKAAGVEKGK